MVAIFHPGAITRLLSWKKMTLELGAMNTSFESRVPANPDVYLGENDQQWVTVIPIYHLRINRLSSVKRLKWDEMLSEIRK